MNLIHKQVEGEKEFIHCPWSFLNKGLFPLMEVKKESILSHQVKAASFLFFEGAA